VSTAENLAPYNKAAMRKFLEVFPEIDAVQFSPIRAPIPIRDPCSGLGGRSAPLLGECTRSRGLNAMR